VCFNLLRQLQLPPPPFPFDVDQHAYLLLLQIHLQAQQPGTSNPGRVLSSVGGRLQVVNAIVPPLSELRDERRETGATLHGVMEPSESRVAPLRLMRSKRVYLLVHSTI